MESSSKLFRILLCTAIFCTLGASSLFASVLPSHGYPYLTYNGNTVAGSSSLQITMNVGESIIVQCSGQNIGSTVATSGGITLEIWEVTTQNGNQINLTSVTASGALAGQNAWWAGNTLGTGQVAQYLHIEPTWQNWTAGGGFKAMSATFTVLKPGTYHLYNKMYLTDGAGNFPRDPSGSSPNTDDQGEATYLIGTLVVQVPAPTAMAASNISQNSFRANWSSVSGATDYRLDVSPYSDFHSLLSGYSDQDMFTSLYCDVVGLGSGSTYYYRVRAKVGTVASANSNIINLITIPGNPLVSNATNPTQTSFTANWEAMQGATTYYLDVSTNSSFSNYVSGYQNLNVGNVVQKTVSGLIPGTTYYFRVRAANSTGTSGNSSVGTGSTLAGNTIPTMTTTAASNITSSSASSGGNVTNDGGASVTARGVCWNTVSSPTISNSHSSNGTGTGAFTSTLGSLSVGTLYYVRAYATNSMGTGYGNELSFVTVPAAPVALTAINLTENSFTASWNASTGASGYYLDVATTSGFTTFVSGYNSKDVGNVTSASVSGLAAAMPYYYRLRAYNRSGTSGLSNAISLKTPPAQQGASIKPITASISYPKGGQLTVQIKVGDPTAVTNLYGVSFKLKSDNSLCTYVDGSASAGVFLGASPVTFFQKVDNQTVDITVTKSAAPGVSGSGIVASAIFATSSSIASGSIVTFFLESVAANDPSGTTISLTPVTLSVTITDNTVAIWPGDCDNNGVVNGADVLRIGLYYAQTNGPVTNNPGTLWQMYNRRPWAGDIPPTKVFADANGDGTTNGADVLAVGLNYGKTHSLGKTVSSPKGEEGLPVAGALQLRWVPSSVAKPGDMVEIYLRAEQPVFGVAFRLVQSGEGEARTMSLTSGASILGGELLEFSKEVIEEKALAVALTRTKGGGFLGDGLLARVSLSDNRSGEYSIGMVVTDITANDAEGKPVKLDGSNISLSSSSIASPVVPKAFVLGPNYPNPFNPSTSISYGLPVTAEITIVVFDILGRTIKTLVQEQQQSAGSYTLRWNGTNERGELVGSGLYFYRIVARGAERPFVATRQMLLVK